MIKESEGKMLKERINVFDYAETILKSLQKGVLLTSKAGDTVNSMTISWGTLGIEWATPIFIAYIREHRYTRELLENGDSFTVNIPLDGANRKPLGILGVKSGRNSNKIVESGITYIPSEKIDAPAVKEYALTLECKIVYKQLQDRTALDVSKMEFYPQDVDGSFHDRNKDFHVAFYGEIVDAYIIKG